MVGICAAGLILRGKQKTLVARQLEKPDQSVQYLQELQDANLIQKNYILYGAGLSEKASDLGTGCFVVVVLNKMGCLVPFLGQNFLPAGFLFSFPNPMHLLLVTHSA